MTAFEALGAAEVFGVTFALGAPSAFACFDAARAVPALVLVFVDWLFEVPPEAVRLLFLVFCVS